VVYNIFHVGTIDPMDQRFPYGNHGCPHMQGSRVPSHSFSTFSSLPWPRWSHCYLNGWVCL